ncbi:MAG: homoserine kinase [Eubacteriales bacterium]
MLQVKIPATSANLGPGFDCMGLAVNLYNTITVKKSQKTNLRIFGTYINGIPLNENNLLWKTICHILNKVGKEPQPLEIRCENNVPPARGLGSSSTAIVGGLLIGNQLVGNPFNRLELLQIANELEGHPDNVTPALYGGVTLSVVADNKVIPRVIVKSPDFKIVVIIPDILVKTEKARKIVPSLIPKEDAIFNFSRVGLLVESFIHKDYELLSIATQDRIHQNQRASLIPGMPEALKSAQEAGAYGSALSGSGPTLIAFCPHGTEQKVSVAMIKALQKHSLQAVSLILDVEPEGAKIITI